MGPNLLVPPRGALTKITRARLVPARLLGAKRLSLNPI